MASSTSRGRTLESPCTDERAAPILARETTVHRGRFAPTPTGPLHFGSIIAALGSCLEARRRSGEWLVRIDDVDGPRNATGAADSILADLERLGFQWDGEVCFQSARNECYREALERLRLAGWTFPCGCSRRDYDGVYPGTCRYGLAPGKRARTRRLRVADVCTEFVDAIQGPSSQRLDESVGDFVIRRADGIFAYHLAAVVDDAEFGISDIVRGADLLESTHRQVHLQRCLDLPTPQYAHLPIAVNGAGQKLSKQTYAEPVSDAPAVPLLIAALEFLGQQPPAELGGARLEELWHWAIANWRMDRVPRQRAIHWPKGKAAPYVAQKPGALAD